MKKGRRGELNPQPNADCDEAPEAHMKQSHEGPSREFRSTTTPHGLKHPVRGRPIHSTGNGPSLRPYRMWLGYSNDDDLRHERIVLFRLRKHALGHFPNARKVEVRILPHIFPVTR